MVEDKFSENLCSGVFFVFVNKDCDWFKMLYFDGMGLWVFVKCLEKGWFSWLVGSDCMKLLFVFEVLMMFLVGIDLKDGCKKVWYEC